MTNARQCRAFFFVVGRGPRGCARLVAKRPALPGVGRCPLSPEATRPPDLVDRVLGLLLEVADLGLRSPDVLVDRPFVLHLRVVQQFARLLLDRAAGLVHTAFHLVAIHGISWILRAHAHGDPGKGGAGRPNLHLRASPGTPYLRTPSTTYERQFDDLSRRGFSAM